MTKALKVWILLPALLAAHFHVAAQNSKGKKKETEKEKVPVYNYVIDDPMDVFGRQPVPGTVYKNILLPEFFMGGSYQKQIKDTTFLYTGYNAKDEMIVADTLGNYQWLRYFSATKTYADPTQTYKDKYGNDLPLPVQKIIYRYDRIGDNKWMYINYTSNKQVTMQEDISEIVRTDTTAGRVDTTGVQTISIFKYYKVSAVK